MVWLRDAWVLGPRGADQGQPSEGLQPEGKRGGVACDAMVPTQDTSRQEQYLMGGSLPPPPKHPGGAHKPLHPLPSGKSLPFLWRLEGAPAEGRFVS